MTLSYLFFFFTGVDFLTQLILITINEEEPAGRWILLHYGAFSHDVTAAILVFQNNETAAILVYPENPLGVEFFCHVNAFFCSNKLAQKLAT